MNGSLAMRSTRLRTLLLVLVGGGMVLSLYLLTSSQYHLKDARRLLDGCQQQKDSLLAQLQVVYEQKNRVEKSLQQEKLDHRKTQEESQKNNALRLQLQKAKTEVDTKLSALQKEQLSLQERYRDLESQTKDLREQQTQNEDKHLKLQTEYEQSIRSREEEISLLRGNLTLALQERDSLENQVVQLNHNYQQMKNDFIQYKRMYMDINQRLKKLSQEKREQQQQLQAAVAAAKADPRAPKLVDADKTRGEEPPRAVTTTTTTTISSRPSQEHHHHHQAALNAREALDQAQQEHGVLSAETPQRSPDQRHPLPPPNLLASKTGTEEGKPSSPPHQHQQAPSQSAGDLLYQGRPEGAGQLPMVSDLRQQLQPPDFGPDHAHHADEQLSAGVSSPGPHVGVGGNQPLLPPPPPQDKGSQLDPHQGEAPRQSQEQKDQDTMVRKPILDGHLPGLAGQDLRAQDNMFMGGMVPPWNPMAMDLPVAQSHQQIKSPDVKGRPSNNNNNRHQEEDENYPEDGDDDNAEEQDDTLRDKNVKPFQDHDFEDNDGIDHNQAKEEGIVIAPK